MKKVLLILFIISIVSTSFAQELSEGLKAKNDGNDAYRNKDYVSAIENWEKYLNSGEEGAATDENTKGLYVNSFKYAATDFMKEKDYAKAYQYLETYLEKGGEEAAKDGKIAYYMAYSASKMDKNDLALSHYQKATDLGYRQDACLLYMADIYKSAGNEEKMEATLKTALKQYPDSKYRSKMVSMLTIPMLQNAAVPFNEANELAKVAASSDPASYLTNMEKAVSKFKVAIPLFEEVLEFDPKNEQALTYINASKDNIKSFNEYKANLNN
ncbi:tetratricopeptide repeat protein [Roseimarinus sediminis]|uniref:tetratricopeptide repeat protein n=1 Tax=Roseimarinus sediminis TaxID=1610899 RepID=UPI003D21834F